MEQIEQRKEKAAELSSGRHANTDYAPKLTPYERKKQCSLCNVVVCTALITLISIRTILEYSPRNMWGTPHTSATIPTRMDILSLLLCQAEYIKSQTTR